MTIEITSSSSPSFVFETGLEETVVCSTTSKRKKKSEKKNVFNARRISSTWDRFMVVRVGSGGGGYGDDDPFLLALRV